MKTSDIKAGTIVKRQSPPPAFIGRVVDSYVANDGKVIVQITTGGRESHMNIDAEELDVVAVAASPKGAEPAAEKAVPE